MARMAEIVDDAIAAVIRVMGEVPKGSDGYRRADQTLNDLLKLRGENAFVSARSGGK